MISMMVLLNIIIFFNKFVNDYVKKNQKLKDLIVLNNDNKKDTEWTIYSNKS